MVKKSTKKNLVKKTVTKKAPTKKTIEKEIENEIPVENLEKKDKKKIDLDIVRASSFLEIERGEKDYIDTGLKTLNYNLSGSYKYGFLRGRMIEIYGWEGTGKSTLALKSIAKISNEGEKILYIDSENALDLHYAKNIGVNLDNLYIFQDSCLERGVDKAIKVIGDGFSAIVFDSIAMSRPMAELDGSMEDQQMGLHARVVGKGLGKINDILSKKTADSKFGKTFPTLFIINQLRMKIGAYGNPETTQGGNSIRFYSSYRIELKKSTAKEKIEEDFTVKFGEFESKQKNISKVYSQVYIPKNKLYVPFKKFTLGLTLGKGYDEKLDFMTYLESLGAVEYTPGNKTLKILGQGMNLTNFFEKLKSDRDFKNKIKKIMR